MCFLLNTPYDPRYIPISKDQLALESQNPQILIYSVYLSQEASLLAGRQDLNEAQQALRELYFRYMLTDRCSPFFKVSLHDLKPAIPAFSHISPKTFWIRRD